jgi:hypothetical protein
LLSFIELKKNSNLQADFLVLNSLVNLKKASSILVAYKTIDLYLDHDEAGRRAYTTSIMHQFPGARDDSGFYCNPSKTSMNTI